MKTIGLLGGMSWESTATYYRLLNQGASARLGGLSSAQLVLYSVDFGPIEARLQKGDWQGIGDELALAAARVEAAGAELLLLCTNTMHRLAPRIQEAIGIPFVHIADPTARALVQGGHQTVGLLGTAPTMELDFYRGRLAEKHGLTVLTPPAPDRALVDRVIFRELCLGKVLPESRQEYARIVKDLAQEGATAVIFGCTEIAMLLDPADSPLPAFDTTALHAAAALDLALA